MTAGAGSSERLAEVLRLASALADRALDAQIMGLTVPDDQVTALAKAARLLQDHGMEWPPLLSQVMHDLVQDAATAEPDPELSQALAQAVRGGLSRFFAPTRGEPQG